MRKPTPAQWQTLFLVLAVLLGGWLRFAPTLLAGEVVNDGGMFYDMARAVHANDYRLPESITYNGLEAPFTYPPLPFYLVALLTDLFPWPLIAWFRWLPALASTLSIPALYLLARALTKSPSAGTLAALAYALIPRSYTWFVMGGGVSRAPGQLFLILTLWAVLMAFTAKRPRYTLLAALFGALTALSHPGELLHAVVLSVLLWLFLAPRDIRRAGLIALGVAILSSPWWLTVLLRYGPGPFLAAAQTGGLTGLFWLPLIIPDFAEEQFLTLFTVFGLLGLALQLIRREYLLPALLGLPFLTDPRSAPAIGIIPLAVLAGIGLNDLILPGVASLAARVSGAESAPARMDWPDLFTEFRSVRWLLGYILFVSLLGAYAYDQPLARTVVPASSKEAMTWVRQNTSPDDRFIILTGIDDPFADPVQEWFPVLAQRVSLSTIQGREWSLGPAFMDYHAAVRAMQGCLNAGPDCVEAQASSLGLEYDYLYLLKIPISSADGNASARPGTLYHLLGETGTYELVYDTAGVAIYAYDSSGLP